MLRFKVMALALILLAINSQLSWADNTYNIQLKNTCPPSFELTEQGICNLVNLYQQYDSIQNVGVGGLQSSLPKGRDGFTPNEIDLGRYLFFDPLLSKDGSISCASCHVPEKGFSDDLAKSVGISGQVVSRSAPTLWNVGFIDKLFWDARAKSLEEQAIGPLFAKNEMGNTAENLLKDLRDNASYMALFKQTFPNEESIELPQVIKALVAFQSSLISLNSRYDQYAHGYHQALTENEISGLNIFRSFVARCAECHQPPLFTNNQIAVIGVAEKNGDEFDAGAQTTFNADKLRGGFKVPTLRNVVKTKPYMHAGNFTELRDAVEFYNKGRGHEVPEGESLQLHWHIWEPNLTDNELDLIVEFLGALTDESLTPELPKALPSGLPVIDAKYQQDKQ
ncbi:cytochrome-c peroxidase [Paraglaciecola sp.]|uniref:cytochrome-c peroxidase n=1 Tax=Paraglaciecola sp. TaxID=1920173 RepID=UPI003EFA5159